MPSNGIRQTRARRWAHMEQIWHQRGDHRNSQPEAILQGETHQAGNDVVETDQFGRAIASLKAQKEFGSVFVVMDAEIERALADDFDFLRDLVATVGEGKALTHDACSSSEADGSVRRS